MNEWEWEEYEKEKKERDLNMNTKEKETSSIALSKSTFPKAELWNDITKEPNASPTSSPQIHRLPIVIIFD